MHSVKAMIGLLQPIKHKVMNTINATSNDVTFNEFFKVFLKIGLLSFGGPAAQISLMHRILVDEEKWLSEQQYLNALGFCMLLPGPEAMQLATYAGWRIRGIPGGLVSGLLFVIPGALIILAFAMIYMLFGSIPIVNALFLGVKAAVLIIVFEALLRVSKRALKVRAHWILAALAFIGIFFLSLPFPLVILMAALYGYIRSKPLYNPESVTSLHHIAQALDSTAVRKMPAEATGAAKIFQSHRKTNILHSVFTLKSRIQDNDKNSKVAEQVETSLLKASSIFLIGIILWLLPIILIVELTGVPILATIGLFFSKLAVVTFGGAYAVLVYMAQDVVTQFGWLSAGEMMDGLGLAETTPGPLILVTEFVGFIAAYREGGLLLGFIGALITLWVTFVPCFIWIFIGAPYIEWIYTQHRLSSALAAITAAVVGVILNLSIWFSLHVFFSTVTPVKYGVLTLWIPELSTFDWRAGALSLLCGFLLLKFHFGIGKVLMISATFGWILVNYS